MAPRSPPSARMKRAQIDLTAAPASCWPTMMRHRLWNVLRPSEAARGMPYIGGGPNSATARASLPPSAEDMCRSAEPSWNLATRPTAGWSSSFSSRASSLARAASGSLAGASDIVATFILLGDGVAAALAPARARGVPSAILERVLIVMDRVTSVRRASSAVVVASAATVVRSRDDARAVLLTGRFASFSFVLFPLCFFDNSVLPARVRTTFMRDVWTQARRMTPGYSRRGDENGKGRDSDGNGNGTDL